MVEVVPRGIMGGVREVEVCFPHQIVRYGGGGRRIWAWVQGLVSRTETVEIVLLNFGVRRVRVGEWVVLSEWISRGDVLDRDMCERWWGYFEGLKELTEKSDGVQILVEFAASCPVRMECVGCAKRCGEACFRENFLVREIISCRLRWLVGC